MEGKKIQHSTSAETGSSQSVTKPTPPSLMSSLLAAATRPHSRCLRPKECSYPSARAVALSERGKRA